jgi:glycosyltransferase involved in cell wall biosynthesis
MAAHKNIHYHGFVDIESQEFREVLDECGILVNPSISEGGAVSVLNILGNGALLPVYSRGTGLDLSAVGVEVEDATFDSFRNALLAVAELPCSVVGEKAWAAHSLVKEKYSLENYRQAMYEHLKSIAENR